jgi:general stress protein 26
LEVIDVQKNKITKAEAKERSAKILSGVKTVYLATNGSHGHPNLRAMTIARVSGVKTIWFAAAAGSSKFAELERDGKAVVYASDSRKTAECRLWGYVEIFDDPESKKIVWRDELEKFLFVEGIESPDVRALRFTVTSGIYRNKTGAEGEF